MGRFGTGLCILLFTWSLQASEIVDLVRRGPGSESLQALERLFDETSEPGTRAVLLRIATVWGARQLLPRVEELAGSVVDPALAREVARTLVLLGGIERVDEALLLSDRFDRRLDPDVALALARHGGIEAILGWQSSFASRPVRSITRDYLLLALWERPMLLPITSGRILGSRDAHAWASLISIIEDSRLALTRPILEVALTAEPPLSDPTFWYLARIYATRGVDDPQAMLDFLWDLDETKRSVEGKFAVELIQRAAGLEPTERNEWISWLASSDPKPAEFVADFGRFLTSRERRALGEPDWVFDQSRGERQGPRPQFHFMHDLPPAWVDLVLEETGCETYWIGQPSLALDLLGRVESIDVRGVHGGPGCVEAVELLGKLSLVANRTVTAPRANAKPLIVKGPTSVPCVAEAIVPLRPDTPRLAVDPSAAPVDLPRVVHRVPAGVPAELRSRLDPPWEDAVSVRAEVAPDGCVRVYGLDAQSTHSEINTAALMAVSMWEMAPGTLRGEPIPVEFNLTVTFSWRGNAVASRK